MADGTGNADKRPDPRELGVRHERVGAGGDDAVKKIEQEATNKAGLEAFRDEVGVVMGVHRPIIGAMLEELYAVELDKAKKVGTIGKDISRRWNRPWRGRINPEDVTAGRGVALQPDGTEVPLRMEWRYTKTGTREPVNIQQNGHVTPGSANVLRESTIPPSDKFPELYGTFDPNGNLTYFSIESTPSDLAQVELQEALGLDKSNDPILVVFKNLEADSEYGGSGSVNWEGDPRLSTGEKIPMIHIRRQVGDGKTYHYNPAEHLFETADGEDSFTSEQITHAFDVGLSYFGSK